MKISNILPKLSVLVTSLLISQAYAAAAFSPIDQPLGYIGPIELSNNDLAGGVKAYRGWFENGAWQGDVIEYDVSATGALSTSIDLSGTSPAQGATATNWSAYLQFDTNDNVATYWDTGRKIITYNGSVQVPFRFDTISSAQQQAIDAVAFGNNNTTSSILDFVRGDRSNEFPTGIYRARFSILGDVIHSSPEYVQIPNGDIPDSSYVTFINANASRAGRVYIGANDGMLHALDAATGNEVWAYIPSALIENLSKLAGRPFSHTYFVDGGSTVSDAFFSSKWHSVLAGGLGGGGKGLYVLDVTSPDLSSETSTAASDKKVIKELLSTDSTYGNDVGYIFGPAVIAKLNDDNWYIVAGNGVSSVNGVAKLFLIDLETGGVKTLSTASGSAGSPNGLSAPALVDIDSDGKADIVYAGDIDGDLWKFDLTDVLPANWSSAYKLYDGLVTQPITTSPEVTTHPVFGYMVMYGTGRLFTAADIIDISTQSLFGIWDKGVAPVANSKLVQLFSANEGYTATSISETVRTVTTTTPINWATNTGWQIDLAAGERLLTPAKLRSGRLKATITNPNGFENWLVELDFADGGYVGDSIFDLDQNGVLDTLDRVDANIDGDLLDLVDIPMAWKRSTGNMSQVTIARIGLGVDTLFLNYLNPSIIPSVCTGDCAGGLGGGHMDVDSDANIVHQGGAISNSDADLGNATMAHEHQYDDQVNRTYVDYFDIIPPPLAAGDLYPIDSVVAAGDQFVILIANADLSPGSELTIGTWKVNVVEYQRLIQVAMRNWNGNPNTLKDPSGRSLVFTLADLQAGGGTLRSTFDSLAIINGGLHPTQSGCVKSDSGITNDRWRNGALIIQMVNVNLFTGLGGASALDRITVQNPPDLYESVVLSNGNQVLLTEDINGDGDDTDVVSPLYERYGGLRVTNDAEFLYESTLFWHYGEVAKLLTGNKPCYGEPGWADAVAIERAGIPQVFFDELLIAEGFVDALGNADIDALMTLFNDLIAQGCTDEDEDDGGCKDQFEDLEDLVKLSELVGSSGGGGGSGSPPTGLESAGTTPVVIEGAVTTGGVTSGPNFETGRRTWIDILPE